MNAAVASQLRQLLRELREERTRLEETLVDERRVVRGSLRVRTHGSRGYRRKTPAYYVSKRDGDRQRSIYVRKEILDRVRREVEAYHRFRRGLRRLRELNREIGELFKALCDSLDSPL